MAVCPLIGNPTFIDESMDISLRHLVCMGSKASHGRQRARRYLLKDNIGDFWLVLVEGGPHPKDFADVVATLHGQCRMYISIKWQGDVRRL